MSNKPLKQFSNSFRSRNEGTIGLIIENTNTSLKYITGEKSTPIINKNRDRKQSKLEIRINALKSKLEA